MIFQGFELKAIVRDFIFVIDKAIHKSYTIFIVNFEK